MSRFSVGPTSSVQVRFEPLPYIILNSGLTFREAHDKTNSLQNPKLPDWSILDITQPPTAESGRQSRRRRLL